MNLSSPRETLAMPKSRSTAKPAAAAMKPAPPPGSNRPDILTNPVLHLALLALVALAAYSNSFQVPFFLDDISSIVENKVIRDLSGFLSGAGYSFNPRRVMAYFSVALNYRFGGLDVRGYHAVNLLIHTSTGALVYWLARLTLKTPFAASDAGSPEGNSRLYWMVPPLAALLFVAHPVQTQAVTYIIQRTASLATLFYLLAVACYVRARLAQEEKGSLLAPKAVVLYLVSLAAALAAMRTKEIAATLPVAVLLYEFSFFGTSTRKKLVVLAPLLLTLFIIPVGMLQTGKPLGELLSDVSQITRETQGISRGAYLLTQFSVIATYLRLLVFPANQNLDYDYPVYHSLFTPRVASSFLLILGLLALAGYLYRLSAREKKSPFGCRVIGFGILWFFLTLSVESSVIPIRDVIFEHRLYLPSVGFFLSLTTAAAMLLQKRERVLAFLALAAVLALSFATWQRNAVWRDHLTLWGDTVAKSPQKSRPNDSYAKALSDSGDPKEALSYVQRAIQAEPRNAYAHYNAGRILDKLDRSGEAIGWYQSAIGLKPDLKEAYNNLAVDYLVQGNAEKAAEIYRTVLEKDPSFAEAHNNLGTILREQKRLEEAATHFKLALSNRPGYAKAHHSLGLTYAEQGRLDLALPELQAAVRLKPDNPEFREDLGRATAARAR